MDQNSYNFPVNGPAFNQPAIVLERLKIKLQALSKKFSFKAEVQDKQLTASGRFKKSLSVKYFAAITLSNNQIQLELRLKSGGLLVFIALTFGLSTLLLFIVLGPFGFIFLLLFLIPFVTLLFKVASSRTETREHFRKLLQELSQAG